MRTFLLIGVAAAGGWGPPPIAGAALAEQRRLYVAADGGLEVFDIDAGHKHLKRIPLEGVRDVRGICASASTGRLYVSHAHRILCLDLATEKVLWDRNYEPGCDRISLTPDAKALYVPSGFWTRSPWYFVLDAARGDVVAKIEGVEGTHNVLCGPEGTYAYLASLRHNYLLVADTRTHRIVREVGPFSHSIRPFTVNARGTLCFVNVDHLLGFEVGDLVTGRALHRVEVRGYASAQGKPRKHRCPSHGIGLTPDETEVWVVDAVNKAVHLFDATVLPPKQIATVTLSDEPYWITFGIDGEYAYASTGDVVIVRTRRPVTRLRDGRGEVVDAEKAMEIDFSNGVPARVGDQFGVGRARVPR